MIQFKDTNYKYRFSPSGIYSSSDDEFYPLDTECDVLVAKEGIQENIIDAWIHKYQDPNWDTDTYEAFLHAMEKDD